MSKGEKVVISRMLQWYSWMFFKGFPSMPKGEIVGMFKDRSRVCVFVIDGKDHDKKHNDNGMTMESSIVIVGSHLDFPMTIKSEFR
jgi:hypothetical protein